jgi:transcription elongation factor GreA
MNQYTPQGLQALDAQITDAEADLAAAQLSLGASAEADNNTWHDNPAFEQAKADIDRAQQELRRLKNLRKNAEIVEPTNSGLVEVGTTVTVQFTGEDEPMVFLLAGAYATSDVKTEEGVMAISTSAPVGQALIGHGKGDVVTYLAPSGKEMELTIISVV